MALSIRLEGLPATEETGPGGSRRILLTVTNSSEIVDQYKLSLSGLDEDWYTLVPPSVSLFPGASGRVELTLSPPVGRAGRAGNYPFSVQATSSSDPHLSTSGDSVLRITALGKAGMEVRPLRATGHRASFRVIWKNPSNGPVNIELATRDAEDGLRMFINPVGSVPVPAGEERTVRVTVQPRRRETVGAPHAYELEFLGLRPGTEELLEPGLKRFGQYTYVPPVRALALPPWFRRLPIWALIALLLLLLAVLFLGGRKVGSVVANSAKPTATLTAIATATIPKPTATTAPTTGSTLVPPPRVGSFGVQVNPKGGASLLTPTVTAAPTTASMLIPPPRVGSFGVQVNPEGGASLGWTVQGATQVTLDGKPVGPTGQLPIKVVKARIFVLSASDVEGTVSRLLQVVPPPTKKLSVSLPPQHLDLPRIQQFSVHTDMNTGALTIRWKIQGADQRLLNNTLVGDTGSERVSPNGPRIFVLKVLNGAGVTTLALGLPSPSAPRSQTLVLKLPTIPLFILRHPRAGRPYSLVWKTTNAVIITLNGVVVPPRGSQILRPPLSTKSYILVARNRNGQVTGRVLVIVK